MTTSSRRRFLDTCAGLKPDRPFLWESGLWPGVIERWRKEGLPADADPYEFLGLDRFAKSGVNWQFIPALGQRVVSDDGECQVLEDESGGLIRMHKSLPQEIGGQHLRYPVRDRESWEFVRKRLDPLDPERMEGLDAFINGRPGERNPASGFSGSFDPHAGEPTLFFVMGLHYLLQILMGFEGTAIMLCDAPELIEDIIEHYTWFVELQIKAIFKHRVPDVVFLEEQAASGSGPYMSPEMYRRLILPRLARIVGLCRGMGAPHVLAESSGDCRRLIPMWLEIGVDGLSPLDRGAGMDPVTIRREYGPEVILVGGIHRAVLERSREDIESEVMSNAPTLFAQGRYVPAGDAHFAISKMVSFDNMRYYVDALRRAASL